MRALPPKCGVSVTGMRQLGAKCLDCIQKYFVGRNDRINSNFTRFWTFNEVALGLQTNISTDDCSFICLNRVHVPDELLREVFIAAFASPLCKVQVLTNVGTARTGMDDFTTNVIRDYLRRPGCKLVEYNVHSGCDENEIVLFIEDLKSLKYSLRSMSFDDCWVNQQFFDNLAQYIAADYCKLKALHMSNLKFVQVDVNNVILLLKKTKQ